MRHRGQINEVEVFIDSGIIDEKALGALREKFVSRYEQLYGRSSAMHDARLEIVTARCRSSALSLKPKLKECPLTVEPLSVDAKTGIREIYWAETKSVETTSIFNGYLFKPGNSAKGPCVVETETTSIVVHPKQGISMDTFSNFVINPNT
jgi:N-methylhydantoinase A